MIIQRGGTAPQKGLDFGMHLHNRTVALGVECCGEATSLRGRELRWQASLGRAGFRIERVGGSATEGCLLLLLFIEKPT